MKVGSFRFYNGKDLVLINEINDNYVIAISSSRRSFKIPITSSFYEIDQDFLKKIIMIIIILIIEILIFLFVIVLKERLLNLNIIIIMMLMSLLIII